MRGKKNAPFALRSQRGAFAWLQLEWPELFRWMVWRRADVLHRNCGPIFSSIGSQRRLDVCRSDVFFVCIGYTLHHLFMLRNLQFNWLVLPSWYQTTHLYLIRLQHSHSSRYVNKCISQGFSSRVLGCFCSKNTGIQQLLSHFCHPKASKSFGFLFPGDVMVTQCSGTLDGEICFSDSRWFWFYAPKWSPSFSFFLKSSSFLPFHSCFCSCILHSAQLLIFVSLVWFGASTILHHFPFKLTLS